MPTPRKQFRSPWDFLLIAMTTGLFALFGAINYYAYSTVGMILFISIFLIAAAFGVYGYSIQNGELRILRLGWSKDIKLSDISSVEFKPNAMMGSLRTFGIGGLFGYVGFFKNRILNNYKAYATHRKKTVVILTKKHDQIVVTPDNPEEFVEALRGELK